MPIADNLIALHAVEEAIRSEALKAVDSSDALSAHVQTIHDSLDHLTVLTRIEAEPGSDSHTLQLLAIRLMNNSASALKLGLAGYYQVGFQLVREMLELANLADLFSVEPDKLALWRTADDKTHKDVFFPAKVRLALEKHERFAGQSRQGVYQKFSNYAAHPTYKGFQLIAPDNSPKVGCFFDEGFLGALLYEAARHLAHATLAISGQFDSDDDSVLIAKAAYVDQLRRYHDEQIK